MGLLETQVSQEPLACLGRLVDKVDQVDKDFLDHEGQQEKKVIRELVRWET